MTHCLWDEIELLYVLFFIAFVNYTRMSTSAANRLLRASKLHFKTIFSVSVKYVGY